ncbi:MAG: Nif3-like dinuclear metal center hexameric protein [Bacteroidetes bacterium]|nr:Nif3-like dinuclear metal center hexameric protein [Bacteroidota bacterium]
MSESLPRARDIAAKLESWATPSFAESYDNVGLHVGSGSRIVNRVLVALDLTPDVVDEAVQTGASMILTHHPLLFRAPSRIVDSDFIGELILRLARENITLYSIHTNLDAAHGGVSMALANILGLDGITFLRPNADNSSGMGAIGQLLQPTTLGAFLEQIRTKLKTPILRYTGSSETQVSTVAVCGGSGGSLIKVAMEARANVYVTADLSYHRFFEVLGPDGRCRMALVDAGHYETEKHTEELLCSWLTERFPSVDFCRTSVRTSPIHYHVP